MQSVVAKCYFQYFDVCCVKSVSVASSLGIRHKDLYYAELGRRLADISATHITVSMPTSRWLGGNSRYSELCACCSYTCTSGPATEVHLVCVA